MSADFIQDDLRELELLDGQIESGLAEGEIADGAEEESLEDFAALEHERANRCMNHGIRFGGVFSFVRR